MNRIAIAIVLLGLLSCSKSNSAPQVTIEEMQGVVHSSIATGAPYPVGEIFSASFSRRTWYRLEPAQRLVTGFTATFTRNGEPFETLQANDPSDPNDGYKGSDTVNVTGTTPMPEGDYQIQFTMPNALPWQMQSFRQKNGKYVQNLMVGAKHCLVEVSACQSEIRTELSITLGFTTRLPSSSEYLKSAVTVTQNSVPVECSIDGVSNNVVGMTCPGDFREKTLKIDATSVKDLAGASMETCFGKAPAVWELPIPQQACAQKWIFD
jgi:hypothetical protein